MIDFDQNNVCSPTTQSFQLFNKNGYRWYFTILSPRLQLVYNIVVKAAVHMQQSVMIRMEDRITINEFQLVNDCIMNDYPELWYYQCRYQSSNNLVSTVEILNNQLTVSQIQEINTKMLKINANILSADLSQMSILQKLFFFQAFISKTVVYNLKPDEEFSRQHIRTIVGVFLNRQCVCAAMAKAYKYICDCFGINCIYVLGLGNGIPHAWNIVQVGQFFYHVDPTWNIKDHWNSLYLCVDDRLIKKMDHCYKLEQYKYPKCESMAANYFQVLQRRVFSVKSAQQQFNDIIAVKLVSATEIDDRVGIFFDVPKKPFECVNLQEAVIKVGFNSGMDFSLEAAQKDQLINFKIKIKGKVICDWPNPNTLQFGPKYIVMANEQEFVQKIEQIVQGTNITYSYKSEGGFTKFQFVTK